jgi:hypothetical protein
MDGLRSQEINQQQVRPVVWLLAGGALFLVLLVGLTLTFFKTAVPVEAERVDEGQLSAVSAVEENGPPGKTADDVIDPTLEPIQTMVTNREDFYYQGGDVRWRLNPRATFIIAGRITSSKRYHDEQGELLPYDLIMTWGELSNPAVDQWLSWEQSLRIGHFNWSANTPYTREYINSHAANIHIIPASDNLEQAIGELELNDTALMAGLLVDAYSKEGYIETSLTREDTGLGACEVYYLERLVVDGIEYR